MKEWIPLACMSEIVLEKDGIKSLVRAIIENSSCVTLNVKVKVMMHVFSDRLHAIILVWIGFFQISLYVMGPSVSEEFSTGIFG